MKRARGFALMDFIAGSVILAGAVTAWASLTNAQLESAAFADRRQQARNACARALDDARAEDLESLVSELGKPGPDGVAIAKRFQVPGLPTTSSENPGRLEARPLKTETRFGCYEVRATVRWKNPNGVDQVELSTILGAKK